MKIFAIRNNFKKDNKDLAYLIYYESEKKFFIEIPDDITTWDVPILLSTFVKRGKRTVNSYWSKIWVQQRIVPSDRQNLGYILRDNGLKEYDEYNLLMIANGRCEQDECYLVSIKPSDLPESFSDRFGKRIDYAICLNDYNMIVFFKNGETKKCNLEYLFHDISKKNSKYANYSVFQKFEIMPGGYGINWNNIINIDSEDLYKSGTSIPLKLSDFKTIAADTVISVSEAAQILSCSRQNIDDLVKRNKLRFASENGNKKLLFRDEVQKRKQQ